MNRSKLKSGVNEILVNGKKVKLKEIECHTLSVDTPKDLEKVREVIKNKLENEA